MNRDSLTNAEIYELLTSTLHGPLPKETMQRIYTTLATVPGLRLAVERLERAEEERLAARGDAR